MSRMDSLDEMDTFDLIALLGSILLGGVLVGLIGFSLGFYVPMILDPGAAQGPLLGIFFTGPMGLLVGAVGGAICWRRLYWRRKQARKGSR